MNSFENYQMKFLTKFNEELEKESIEQIRDSTDDIFTQIKIFFIIVILFFISISVHVSINGKL